MDFCTKKQKQYLSTSVLKKLLEKTISDQRKQPGLLCTAGTVLFAIQFIISHSMKGYYPFLGMYDSGIVGLCNNVFPIVLSMLGFCCHVLQFFFHKHPSTVNLAAQEIMLLRI